MTENNEENGQKGQEKTGLGVEKAIKDSPEMSKELKGVIEDLKSVEVEVAHDAGLQKQGSGEKDSLPESENKNDQSR